MTPNQNPIEILYNAYLFQYKALSLNGAANFNTPAMQDTILNSMLKMTFEDIHVGEQFLQAQVVNGDMVTIELVKTMMQVVGTTQFFFNNAVTELSKLNVTINPDQLKGMTLHQAIKFSEGKEPEELFKKRGIVAGTYKTLDSGLGKAVDVTVDSVRLGANWLGQKIVKWTEKK